jgi:hypothetical protein
MKILIIFALVLFAATAAEAVVSISTVQWSGSMTYGRLLTVSVSGIGTKPVQQQTYFLANGEDAAAGVAGTTWCVTSSMGDIQNVQRVTTTCFEGTGCFGKISGLDTNKVNTARVSSVTDVGPSGKWFMSWVWRWIGTQYSDTVNVKTYRVWPNSIGGTGGKNNLYGGQQVDGSFVNLTENDDGLAITNIDRKFTNDIEPDVGVDGQVEFYMKNNSAAGAQDGTWKIDEDRQERMNMTTWRSLTTADAANGRFRNFYPIHMVITGSGASFNADADYRFDDIIVETSHCVVWVTTASTHAALGKKYFLAVQTWSPAIEQVTAVFPQKFSNGTQLYLYVQNNSDEVNSSGAAITFSGGGAPPVQNDAPSVSAGSTQTVTFPDAANLVGSASDDGNPNPPSTLTVTWSKVSGPGSVIFGSTNSVTSTAVFGSTGTYFLRLSAYDSSLTSTNDVQITVQDPPTVGSVSRRAFKFIRSQNP